MMENFQDPNKIAWITNIHCIGKRWFSSLRVVICCLQVLGNDVIRITRRNEMTER